MRPLRAAGKSGLRPCLPAIDGVIMEPVQERATKYD